MVYALTVAGHDNLPVAIGDRFFFVEGAKLLADGHGFVHPFVWLKTHHGAASAGHPPLWTVLLAGPAKLGIDGYRTARVIGAIVGTGAVVVIGLLGRRFAGPRAGLIAAGLAAVYLPFVVSDTSGMSEALYLLLVGLTVLALLAARDSRRLGLTVLAGVAGGLATLTRTEGLLLVPLVAWPLLGGRRALVATLAAVAVVLPWTVRNAVVLDRFVLVSTNESTVLAGANCPQTYHGRDLGSWRPDCLARATAPFTLSNYDEGELAARWSHTGRQYARDHAARLPAVVPVRVMRTWRLWQPGREGRLSEGENDGVAEAGGVMFLVLLLPAGLIALLLVRPARDRLLVLAALAGLVTLTSAAGWGNPRFLRPAELALLLAAGLGVDALLRHRSITRGPAVSPSGSRPSRPM